MPANTSGVRRFNFPPPDGAGGGSGARCLDTDSTIQAESITIVKYTVVHKTLYTVHCAL